MKQHIIWPQNTINGTETCTQMILTLNGKQYAPKYVKITHYVK